MDIPVENIRLIDSETSEDDEKTESDEKSRLVREIHTQEARSRELRGYDLKDANLRDGKVYGMKASEVLTYIPHFIL